MPFHFDTLSPISKFLFTDSRFLTQAADAVFFAIKGVRHDGHLFIDQLLMAGIKEFVVEKSWAKENENYAEKADFWVVDNTTKALQQLAANHRKKFKIPIVGISGSNGKTIVKEWLNQMLLGSFEIAKSPRSYNSQIGVPLSVWQLQANHTLGIFEAGISQEAEMQKLQEIILPEIGIFTNIGSAHDEGFRSRKQKITEKLRLFRQAKTLIYCHDYADLDEETRIFLKAVNPKIELISWSLKGRSTINVDLKTFKDYSQLIIYWNGDEYNLNIPFIDNASIENAIHCFFAAYLLLKNKYNEIETLQVIQRGLNSLKPIAMRLELKEGINNCFLIDDTYNNDYGGLNMALNFMSQHHFTKKKTVILSDVLQSNLRPEQLYAQIAELLHAHDVAKVIGIGPAIAKYSQYFENFSAYHSTEDFLLQHPIQQFSNELLLIKGARAFTFEKIVDKLIAKVHGTVFEINLDAITHNLNFYRSGLSAKTKIMVMVKASAYGSGSTEVASLLQYHRVDYLSVAYADEGVFLRENGIKLPIMVLNTDTGSYAKILEYKLEPEIFSIRSIRSFIQFLEATDFDKEQSINIHLKIDTGMNRLGFSAKDTKELLELLQQHSYLKVASIFSHLAGADGKEHNDFTRAQIQQYELISKQILDGLNYHTIRHIANSAGMMRFPEAEFDMVRLGIGLYGVEATGQMQSALQTVGTLKTTISQIKEVKKGETVGYSRKGIVQRDSRIATIAIGYADGFARQLSQGNGVVLIDGKECPVIGNVCMDMTMVDITDTHANEGDPVEIFGPNLSIFDMAKRLQTIPYEILTRIGSRVKRIYYKE